MASGGKQTDIKGRERVARLQQDLPHRHVLARWPHVGTRRDGDRDLRASTIDRDLLATHDGIEAVGDRCTGVDRCEVAARDQRGCLGGIGSADGDTVHRGDADRRHRARSRCIDGEHPARGIRNSDGLGGYRGEPTGLTQRVEPASPRPLRCCVGAHAEPTSIRSVCA